MTMRHAIMLYLLPSVIVLLIAMYKWREWR